MTVDTKRARELADKAQDGTEYSPDGHWIPDLTELADMLRSLADELDLQRRVEEAARETCGARDIELRDALAALDAHRSKTK